MGDEDDIEQSVIARIEDFDDFPWWRVPGYVVVQPGGATFACLFLRSIVGSGGARSPGRR